MYTHPLGNHLWVHSKLDKAPTARDGEGPHQLVVVCHGYYSDGTGTTQVPASPPEIYFASAEGQPHMSHLGKDIIDFVKNGIEPKYDFEHPAAPNSNIIDIKLGKGAPDRQGTFTRDGKRKIASGNWYKEAGDNSYVNKAYGKHLMGAPGHLVKNRDYSFDVATIRKSCDSLSKAFASLRSCPNAPYTQICFLMCREKI